MQKYYRVTCENIGIYEYFKNYLWSNVQDPKKIWSDFICSNQTSWLKNPNVYIDKNKKYNSFFTKEGYELFKEKTLPLIVKWLDIGLIKTDIVCIKDSRIIYHDENQVVIELNNVEK